MSLATRSLCESQPLAARLWELDSGNWAVEAKGSKAVGARLRAKAVEARLWEASVELRL